MEHRLPSKTGACTGICRSRRARSSATPSDAATTVSCSTVSGGASRSPVRRTSGTGPGYAATRRWTSTIEFQPPVYHFVDTGAVVTGTGAPEGEPGKDRVNVRICHAITPETERTSHYFWSVAHELGEVMSDPAAREDYYAQMRQVIGEDVTVLETQQRSMDIHGVDAPSIGIASDAGPIQAIQHEFVLVTRNEKDFVHFDMQLLNPWHLNEPND